MKKIERYDNYKLIPIPPQCTTAQCEFKRVSDNEKCTVSIKDLDQLERERGEAVEIIKAVIKWNTDYPSSRIYSHGQIVGIAKEMDDIFERCKTAVESWQELKEMKG